MDDDLYFNDSYYSLGENDDLIFKQNVTSSIELDARKESTVTNETNDLDSLENPPSDELQSVHSKSEEEVVQFPKFNAEKKMLDPELEVGKKFRSREESKAAAKNFSVNNRFKVRFPINDADSVKVICKGDKCP
ncbi:SWIM-type domain-containing protein [Abeliophyllum distichum]|uniref:SWIM-type domain-containing protein n=1 Tax=Abeliophyllum distichum TaxID=126358 RepID=A0ABD1QW99_9LAMI